MTIGGRLKRITSMVFRRQNWKSWFLPTSRFDYLLEVGDGTDSSTVMAPLLWIGRTFPEAPPMLWSIDEDGNEEQVPHHDLLRLLTRPNPFYSGATLWMATLMDYNVDGNGYWIKIRNQVGAVQQLWYTPSWMMEPEGDEQNFITKYIYTIDGRKVELQPEDVVHFRFGLDPENQRKGRSPLKTVLREVFTDDEAARFTAALLKNMGVPGILVSPDSDNPPGPDDVTATKEYVDDEFRGENRGKALVMSGKTKVQEFGFSPEQLDLKSLRRIPEERTTAVLGVPAIVAGLGAGLDRSTFANMSEAREMAYESNIIPTQRTMGEEVRFQLLTDFEVDPWVWRFGFDLSNVRVLQEDRNKQATRWGEMVKSGYARVAEARREFGLETTDADEVYLRSIAIVAVPAGEVREEDTLEEPPPIPPPPGVPAEEEPAAPGEEGDAPGDEPKIKARQTRAQVTLDRALQQDQLVLAAVMGEKLEAVFDGMGKEAAELAKGRGAPGIKELNGHDLKDADDNSASAIALQVSESADGRLKAEFERHYGRTAQQTEATIEHVLGLGANIPDEVMVRIIQEGGTRRALLDVQGETRDAILRAVAEGREAGDAPAAIARRIRDEVPKGRFSGAGAKYRAELIARTETLHAQRGSSLEAYKASDSVTSVVAFDGRLGDTDDVCMARDGQTFSLEAAELEMASEDTHPNCTLSFAPVVAETLSELEGVTA